MPILISQHGIGYSTSSRQYNRSLLFCVMCITSDDCMEEAVVNQGFDAVGRPSVCSLWGSQSVCFPEAMMTEAVTSPAVTSTVCLCLASPDQYEVAYCCDVILVLCDNVYDLLIGYWKSVVYCRAVRCVIWSVYCRAMLCNCNVSVRLSVCPSRSRTAKDVVEILSPPRRPISLVSTNALRNSEIATLKPRERGEREGKGSADESSSSLTSHVQCDVMV